MTKPIPFKLDTSSEIPKFRADTFWTKEPETIHWINRNLGTQSEIGLFIDVGANIGIYSLYAAEVNSSVSIFAVEPVVSTFNELNKNITMNERDLQITGFNLALSSVSGFGELINVDSRLGSSGAQIDTSSEARSGSTRVLTGDQLLDAEISKYDSKKKIMIKIDTDGNELDVLKGFCRAFASGIVSTVLVETHPTNRDEIEDFFQSFKMKEDVSYLDVEGHSDIRRKEKGNKERTRVYQ